MQREVRFLGDYTDYTVATLIKNINGYVNLRIITPALGQIITLTGKEIADLMQFLCDNHERFSRFRDP